MMMHRSVLLLLSLFVGGMAKVIEETAVQPAVVEIAASIPVGTNLTSKDVLDKAYAVGDSLPDPDVHGANLTSVFGLMADLMGKELRSGSKSTQLATAGISLVLGVVMLWDGLHVFEIFILILSFISVYILMMGNFKTSEYTDYYGEGGQIWEKILSLEVAILVSFTFKFSIGLVKKLLGLSLGIFAFLWLQGFLVALAAEHKWDALDEAATSPYYFIGSALVCFPFGMWLFAEGPSYVFAILSPIFGSIMTSSSLFFFATFFDHQSCVECPPKHAWIDFVVYLLGTGRATEIGPMRGKQLGVSINLWAMWSVTGIMIVLSMYRQVSLARTEKMSNAGTLCDRFMGLFCGAAAMGGQAYQPLLKEKDDQIRELEQQVRTAKGSSWF